MSDGVITLTAVGENYTCEEGRHYFDGDNGFVWAAGNAEVFSAGNITVFAEGDARVHASGHVLVLAKGRANISATGDARVWLHEQSACFAVDHAVVNASDEAVVAARGAVLLFVYGAGVRCTAGRAVLFADKDGAHEQDDFPPAVDSNARVLLREQVYAELNQRGFVLARPPMSAAEILARRGPRGLCATLPPRAV